MFSKSRILGVVAAAGLAGLAALASTPAQAASVITLQVCNHTDKTVVVASSFIPIGGSDWRNKGWQPVHAGACQDIFKTTNRTFYARAEEKNNSDSFWGHGIQQCVEYPGPYDFFTASSDTTCPEGEPAEFTTFHSDGRPVYKWDLTPPD
jgi:uncharacterized membrane protein